MLDVRLLLVLLLCAIIVTFVDGYHGNLQPSDIDDSVKCCINSDVEEECLLTCHRASHMRKRVGGMICEYKYSHVREKCMGGRPELMRRDDLEGLNYEPNITDVMVQTKPRHSPLSLGSEASFLVTSSLWLTTSLVLSHQVWLLY